MSEEYEDQIRQEERERCAKICDDVASLPDPVYPWERAFISGAQVSAENIRNMEDK